MIVARSMEWPVTFSPSHTRLGEQSWLQDMMQDRKAWREAHTVLHIIHHPVKEGLVPSFTIRVRRSEKCGVVWVCIAITSITVSFVIMIGTEGAGGEVGRAWVGGGNTTCCRAFAERRPI